MKKPDEFAALFQTFPELDWLLDLAEYMLDNTKHERRERIEHQLDDVHRMLTWSRRHVLAPLNSEAKGIAFNMLWKYSRRVYNIDMQPDEQTMCNRAAARLKEIRHARQKDG